MFGGAGANLNGVGNGTTNPTSPTSGFGGTGFGSPILEQDLGTNGTNPSPSHSDAAAIKKALPEQGPSCGILGLKLRR